MSRSKKKIAGGTWACCKSQKIGKKICHRKFRRRNDLYKMWQAVPSWDLGGEGKGFYRLDKDSDLYKQMIRK